MQHTDNPVDLLEIARATALREARNMPAGALKVIAPAKINLYLAVEHLRADGYHPVVNIMHTLALHDEVYLWPTPPGEEVVTEVVAGEGLDIPAIAPEDNLARRACTALAEALGYGERAAAPQPDEGGERAAAPHLVADVCPLSLRIVKHVPAQAGLGGGSSDAAAALVGAAQLWGLDVQNALVAALLEQVAATLGADVAFFLRGGCALYDNRGEHFVRSLVPRSDYVVLVRPEEGLSTAAVYREFDSLASSAAAQAAAASPNIAASAMAASYDVSAPNIAAPTSDIVAPTSGVVATPPAVSALPSRAADVVPFNALAPAAETLMPQMGEIRTWLAAQPGVKCAMLSGSGSATFALCESFSAACSLTAAAKQRGLWARSTTLAAARAAAARR